MGLARKREVVFLRGVDTPNAHYESENGLLPWSFADVSINLRIPQKDLFFGNDS